MPIIISNDINDNKDNLQEQDKLEELEADLEDRKAFEKRPSDFKRDVI